MTYHRKLLWLCVVCGVANTTPLLGMPSGFSTILLLVACVLALKWALDAAEVGE